MSVSVWLKQPVTKRLLPLYIAAFAQGFVLWYPIEKLFMTSIGFDNFTVSVMVAAYALFVPIFETPSGILADRWSRKGVLMLASIALALSSLAGALSHSIIPYIICAILWGIFIAMYSGTYDSILYDLLLQENGKSDGFERQLARIKLIDGAALVLSSLGGGLLATLFEPRITYVITIPCILVSLVALWLFKEPQLHKAEVAVPIRKHIKETFGAVLQRGRLLQIVAILTIMNVIVQFTLEFSQLWLVALAAPLVLYGPANSLLMGAYGFGGTFAERLRTFQAALLVPVIGLMLGGAVTLVFAHNAIIITIAQVVVTFLATSLIVIFTKLLHDALPSKVRAGAASAVSTMSWIVFLPFAVLFGVLGQRLDVFNAGWLIVAVTVVGCVLLATAIRGGKLQLTEKDQPLIQNDYR